MHSTLEALPPPHPAARAHSEAVCARIREVIMRAGGAIPFSQYMDLALNAPGLGYYAAGAQKFGRGGDFVTAPEFSPLFSRCVAGQVAEVLHAMGGGEVCELGAGSGAMAITLLSELHALGAAPKRYLIMEPNADLRARQREAIQRALPELGQRVCWLARPPQRLRGVILANEVLDAVPSARFRVTEHGCEELFVAWDNGFVWRALPPSDPELPATLGMLRAKLGYTLAPGYVSEVSPVRCAWVREIVHALAHGVVLLIDYGYTRDEYYHPQRRDGTLTCYYRHRAHDDPLVLTGIQDISVAVDFSAVAETAQAEGAVVTGFTTQAQFLLASGLLELATRNAPPQTTAYAEIARQVKRLTLPGEMGDLVKVMALARGGSSTLTGFSGRDWRHRL